MSCQDFLDGHAECAVWLAYDASTAEDPNGPESYDWGPGPADEAVAACLPWLTAEARIELDRDARDYYRDHRNILPEGVDHGQLGHDFWLSRNGHGAGLWDRGYARGDELHKGAQHYGEGPMLYIDEEAERITL